MTTSGDVGLGTRMVHFAMPPPVSGASSGEAKQFLLSGMSLLCGLIYPFFLWVAYVSPPSRFSTLGEGLGRKMDAVVWGAQLCLRVPGSRAEFPGESGMCVHCKARQEEQDGEGLTSCDGAGTDHLCV